MDPLTASINEALAGTILECLTPNFTMDMLKYFPCIQSMMKGLPRWYILEAYRLRESLIRDINQWYAKARARFRETDIDGRRSLVVLGIHMRAPKFLSKGRQLEL